MSDLNTFIAVSYNIWFDSLLNLERLISLVHNISLVDPDVICLQEVKKDIYEILICELKHYKYHWPKKINYEYGSVTFSKYPISKCAEYNFENSTMGRSLIITKIDYPYNKIENDEYSIENVGIVVVNTHFESLFKSVNHVKYEQYNITKNILENLYDEYKKVILCADTNLLVSEEDKFIKWNDAWIKKGNDGNKYTYDWNSNIYLKFKKYKLRSRIDRILYKMNNCELLRFDIIKAENGTIEPSDHFGVYAEFEIKI